jgi:hypothetical protein
MFRDAASTSGRDRLGRLLGEREVRTLSGESGVCRIEEGEHLRGRALVYGTNDPLGLDRTDAGCQHAVGQRGT